MGRISLVAVAVACAIMGGVPGARAAQQWPASLAGYVGIGQSNETSLTLKILTQGTGALCKTITGTMQDNGSASVTTIDGFYCPYSGHVAFLRIQPGVAYGFQTYSGAVSEQQAGSNIAIAGTFSETSQVNALGEYPFGVQSQP